MSSSMNDDMFSRRGNLICTAIGWFTTVLLILWCLRALCSSLGLQTQASVLRHVNYGLLPIAVILIVLLLFTDRRYFSKSYWTPEALQAAPGYLRISFKACQICCTALITVYAVLLVLSFFQIVLPPV